jgi:hypothetical protein
VRLSSFPAPVFAGLEMGQPLAQVSDARVVATAEGFEVFFPQPLNQQNNQPLRLYFRQQVLEHHTTLSAWLLDVQGGLPQPVAQGNANDLVLTNGLNVYSADPAPALQTAFSSRILTPNGDGANDQAQISYSLIQFAGPIQVDIAIFDLAGRPVRRLFSGPQSSGAYQLPWDGRGEGGEFLPPGNYLCRVQAQAQARSFSATKLLGVVY